WLLHRSDRAVLLHIQAGKQELVFDRRVCKPRWRNPPVAHNHSFAYSLSSSRSHRHSPPGVFRILLPSYRLSHPQVHLHSSPSSCADGLCSLGLVDFSISAALKLFISL